jgi:hypothetical protein
MTTTAITKGPAAHHDDRAPGRLDRCTCWSAGHMNRSSSISRDDEKDPRSPDVVNRDRSAIHAHEHRLVHQDVEIWDNKVRVGNPVLCDGDGPIHMLRKWYSQFYMNIADVPEELVKHKEHVSL